MRNAARFGALFCVFFAAGCASSGGLGGIEDTADANQKILRENEHRLQELETSVTALTSQMAQLNNRVYEVRTRNGQKTSMTVVPITPGAGNSAPNPGPTTPAVASGAPSAAPASTAQKAQPKGRLIDPAAKPSPLPAQKTAPARAAVSTAAATPARASTAGSRGSIGQPENVAGPNGQIAAASGEIGLPPATLPESNEDEGTSIMAPATNVTTIPVESVPVPTGNVTAAGASPAIPVPAIPASDLSLPPEHPDLPPGPTQTATAQNNARQVAAPSQTATPASAPARPAARSEQAAYQAALNAARAGRTSESIRLFNDFLQQYPNSRYTANADYWIGECLYAQGKYQDALNQFQNVNNSFPTHHKNADALLKAGMTLNKLGNNAGAQEKYKTLLSSFPNSDAAKRARAMGVGR